MPVALKDALPDLLLDLESALLGIGRGVLEPADPEPIIAALTGDPDPENVPGMVFRRLADGLGNDRDALIAFLRRPQRPLTQTDLARITTHVLVVLGDKDPAGPGDGLVAALPDARLVTLRGVDHRDQHGAQTSLAHQGRPPRCARTAGAARHDRDLGCAW